MRSLFDRPGMVSIYYCTWTASHKSHIHDLTNGGHLTSSPVKRRGKIMSSVKTSEATSKTDGKFTFTKSDVSFFYCSIIQVPLYQRELFYGLLLFFLKTIF